MELGAAFYAFDASTIDLCLSLFAWAPFRSTKAAIKLHALLDLRGNIPSFIHITDGKTHEVNVIDDLVLEPGAFYLMDRGYLDFARLFDIHKAKTFFVTRAKSNTKFKRRYSHPVERVGPVWRQLPWPVDTERFITAQNPIIDDVLRELGAGRKQSHWMWFIFPQLKALGRSAMAQHYGLEGLQDALDWMAHTVLSARLIDCTQALFKHPSKSIESIMGSPDDLKLRSCMTLFQLADPGRDHTLIVIEEYTAVHQVDDG